MTKRLIVPAVIATAAISLLTGCATEPQYDDQWISLFDGQTLEGWVQRGGQARYFVEDGAIVGETVLRTPNSFLCTKQEYSDFILELDFLVDERLNSGIQIRSESKPEYKSGRVHGYQVEIDPSLKPYTKQPRNLRANGKPAPIDLPRSWTGGIYGEGKRGWLYNLTNNEPARKAFRRERWNHFRIEARGNTIRTWLNGVLAADFQDAETEEMVLKGFIGLQVLRSQTPGLQVRWRNIYLREMP